MDNLNNLVAINEINSMYLTSDNIDILINVFCPWMIHSCYISLFFISVMMCNSDTICKYIFLGFVVNLKVDRVPSGPLTKSVCVFNLGPFMGHAPGPSTVTPYAHRFSPHRCSWPLLAGWVGD